jgi:hypothetical protein
MILLLILIQPLLLMALFAENSASAKLRVRRNFK